MSDHYSDLERRFKQLHHFHHLHSICSWDQETMMPDGGNEARAAALAEVEVLIHQLSTDQQVQALLIKAEAESLSADQQANLREMKRSVDQATALPASLVESQSLSAAKCAHAWRSQRERNDWQGFKTNLQAVVKLAREEAEIRSQVMGLSPYDALLQKFEPGMYSADIDAIFNETKSWLPDLIQQVMDKQQTQGAQAINLPQGPFSIAQQKALGEAVINDLGFDWQKGRLDISAHPFSGGVPEDVRITTRYDESDFTSSLMGIIHETGHGCYEQNRPAEWLGQPLSEARSMGIHESQSLSFEMQIGRSPAFMRYLQPKIKAHFGDQEAFKLENLLALYNRVEPGFIRVDADELTYPLHVILRYEIEQALIEGSIEVDDIPSLWQQKMQTYLGLNVGENHREGCMQDIHWPSGAFGYFPTYTLGAMYAAQLVGVAKRDDTQWDERISQGDFTALTRFMKQHIWQHGSRYLTPDLIQRACGEALNPSWFRQHLEQRYL